MEKFDGLAWPPELKPEFDKMKKLIGRYKFKEAVPVLESLLEKLSDL